jgi:hypothetical protein
MDFLPVILMGAYHCTVQSVKQRESAAYITRLNNRVQPLQEQQVARDHRASLREQRNFFLAIICAIVLIDIAILLFVQHTSHNNQAIRRKEFKVFTHPL